MGNEPSSPSRSKSVRTEDGFNSPRGVAVPSTMDKLRNSTAEFASSSSVFFDDVRSALDIRSQLQKRTFYPLTGKTLSDLIEERGWDSEYPTPQDWKTAILQYLQGTDLQHAIVTSDGRALDCYWVPAVRAYQGLTVVIFHANAMVGLDMFNYAEWYRQRGCAVLAVTMGGYGDSTGTPGELSSYQDALACVDYCMKTRKVPRYRLLLHGLSLGGAMAAAGAFHVPGVHAVLDQTFTSAAAVALSVISKQANWVPNFVVGQATSAMFPEGREDAGITTDGYNTLSKVQSMRGQLFVISASEDDMMPPEFAPQLMEARYGTTLDSQIQSRHVILDGPHCTLLSSDPAAEAYLTRFLDDVSAAADQLDMEPPPDLPELMLEPRAQAGARGEGSPQSPGVGAQLAHMEQQQSYQASGVDQSGKWNI